MYVVVLLFKRKPESVRRFMSRINKMGHIFSVLLFSLSLVGCGSASGAFSIDEAYLLSKSPSVNVFYYNNNTEKEDGSYKYSIEGRKIVEELFRQKGYDVIFSRYRKNATFYVQLNQQSGSTTRSYKSEKVVGTYRDRSGRAIGTYNKPTTRSVTKQWNRVDMWVWDPKNKYDDKYIYHHFKVKSGGNFNTKLRSILRAVISKLPSRN